MAGSIEYNGSCYYFNNDLYDYSVATAVCESHDFHLVFIGSADEQEFLINNTAGSGTDLI